ncbi:efflux transporter outer membrane subunit [Myroides ceti]|uniref:Efflux transporter outer membrane subunit n=1 Tax=Paenimyroides ceti TaxID=395087 RepID=A0ABT8CRJ9_9FLAO|nr:efflux transporter outer membrane subunit [Paenimyroides ceti]MDN3705699.1 efflux transporter outer membrane subunit [Paenimyroides ceti]MDN3709830.1 efflux transporter outer membrane subunit [Paenimyroides ceti]
MKILYRTLAIVVLGATLQSCLATKNYERPEVINESYFRSDNLPQDSLSMAQVSWKTIFKDPVLTNHIEKALENNIDIRVAIENITAAQSIVFQGKMGYYPTLNLGANYTHSVNSENTQIGRIIGRRQRLDQYDITANVSWELDVWGKITSQKKASVASYLQTVATHQAVKTQVISSVASAYFQLLALDEQKAIALSTIANRQQSLETNKALKDAGRITEVAVKQTEAQLFNAEALLLDIENNIKIQENVISVLLGEMPHTIERSTLDAQYFDIDLNTGFPAQLLMNRPDVIAAENGLINAFEMTNVAKTAFYPTLRLTATGGLQSVDFAKLFDPTSLFGNFVAGLAQPILNGRQIRTQYEVSLTTKEKAFLNYKQTILNASKEVSDALYTYETMEKKAVLKEKEALAYSTAVEYSEELLNNGMASYIEVLTAKENELNAELSVVNTQFAQWNALIQLYKALGGGIN